MLDIYLKIKEERAAQEKQWGGFEHDRHHGLKDWLSFIDYQVHRLRPLSGNRILTDEEAANWSPGAQEEECFSRLIKIAALTVAAIETYTNPKYGDE